MEIDLNHDLSEGDGNSDKGVDVSVGVGNLSSSSSSSCSSTSQQQTSSVYHVLWHACAGPLTKLPKKGSLVVYFPQGHLEQIASSTSLPFQGLSMSTFGLQSQIFCRVINVQLLADKENDEVYTQVALLPIPELGEKNLEGKQHDEEMGAEEDGGSGGGDSPINSTPHMFCKTLTASDTSSHGGFSVPRRAAEDCFPPLDYKQQRPSQELLAKDLHGVEWKFRHIYRGQPRRHLLTTGWSNFITQKNLASGDAVLFLRGEDGELRLGIRRAGRTKTSLPNSISGNQSMPLNVLSSVANAVSTKNMFHVFYNPRGSPAEFVIPCEKYKKSITHPIGTGMRFKMSFEMEDRAERRCSGIVTGIGDFDPYKWPNSKWRCLMVRWDEDLVSSHHERVSPWEIDSSTNLLSLSEPLLPRLKKLRSISPDKPVNGTGIRGLFSDFNEPMRSSKVLQGQEKLAFSSPQNNGGKANYPLYFEMQKPLYRGVASTRLDGSNNLMQAQLPSYTGVESARFPKVLQGQEIFPLRSIHGGANFNHAAWGNNSLGCNLFNMYQRSESKFYPFASTDIGTISLPFNDKYKVSMTDFLGGQVAPDISSIQSFPRIVRGEVYNPVADKLSVPATTDGENELNGSKPSCKLFGFSLTGHTSAANAQNSRSCTKVHKQGNLVGRAIDLSKCNSYDDLLNELEQLFNMEGLLRNPEKGWQVVYTDSENDMIVIGDDPWNEFCRIVSKIHIYTVEEVEKMTFGLASDDTSCLEETVQE